MVVEERLLNLGNPEWGGKIHDDPLENWLTLLGCRSVAT